MTSSTSITEPIVAEECEICLGSLSTHDKTYPLLCPVSSGCNICFNCISHLVKMKQSNNFSNSNGVSNRNVSHNNTTDVKTLCPRCQNDVSYSIEDTFLMRKVLKMQSSYTTTTTTGTGSGTTATSTTNVSDSQLSAAELRFKYSVTAEQIEECKLRLEKYQEDIISGKNKSVVVPSAADGKTTTTPTKERVRSSPNRKRIDDINKTGKGNTEWSSGTGGTRTRKSETERKFTPFEIMRYINCDLFQGIQDMLSQAEQDFIFELMTSGEVEKLVQSSQILSELKRIHQSATDTATATSTPETKTSSTTFTTPSFSSKLSLKNIQLSKSKHQADAEIRALRMALSNDEQQKLEEVEYYLELNPLPRLPKHISLEANFDIYAKHGKVLKFRDDGWDGSVSDAFARAYTISTTASDHHVNEESFDNSEYTSSSGFHNDEEDGFINGHKNNRLQASSSNLRDNRVLVYAARKQAAAVGITIGDVVTHVDGNEFTGTAKELREMIHTLYTRGDQILTMVLNAEQITADALKDFAVELNR